MKWSELFPNLDERSDHPLARLYELAGQDINPSVKYGLKDINLIPLVCPICLGNEWIWDGDDGGNFCCIHTDHEFYSMVPLDTTQRADKTKIFEIFEIKKGCG